MSDKNAARTAWPEKSREMHNWAMDSTCWNEFEFRPDDIVICTWAKSGTTWMQQIVSQLVHRASEEDQAFDTSPWLEFRAFPKDEVFELLEKQAHRRYIKSHLPVDALVFSPEAKYIYIGRDGRDVMWSWYNHHASFAPEAYSLINDPPGLVGPPLEPPDLDVVPFFRRWLERDGYPLWPFWPHIQSWWDIRGLDNVLLVHFNQLKSDLEGEMRRIAAFLQVDCEESLWPTLVEHCSFDYMKRNASRLSSLLEEVFTGGAQSFVHKGTNGRWRDMLTADDVARYERAASKHLSPDCARWLATGEGA